MGQTADTRVAQGRVFLAAHDLAAADASFAAAVSLQPGHEAANALLAVTRLLRVTSLPPAQAFMDRLGLTSAGRDIYHWEAALPKDTNGAVVAPIGVSANEFTAFYRTHLIPALSMSASNLARVTNANFLLTVARRESSLDSVTLDYGDAIMLRALAHGLEYFGYTAASWNLDAPLTALQAVATNEARSASEVLRGFPELFTFSTTNELWLAQQAFRSAVDRYLEASAFIRNRAPDAIRLFNLDFEQTEREFDFRRLLTELRTSLQGTVILSEATNLTVHLANLFIGSHSPRSLFPEFAGNDLVLGSWPDLSFGGVIGGLTTSTLEGLFSNARHIRSGLNQFLLVSNVFYYEFSTMPGRSYVVECSTNLADWSEVYAFEALESSFRYFDLINSQPGQRFYRLVDLFAFARLDGQVIDACSGLPLADAAVRLDTWTSTTDSAGRFSIQTRTPRHDAPGFDLEISAAGYESFAGVIYPYDSERFALEPTNVTRPANDDFANRIRLVGIPVSVTGTVCGATSEVGVPRQSVWWTWTAPVTATVSLFVEAPATDAFPQIRVYTGNTIATLRNIASEYYYVQLPVTNGVTYQIELEHVSGTAGAFRLVIAAEPTLVLSSPQDGEEFRAPANILISGIVIDSDGPTPRVDIRADGHNIATVATASFAVVWSNVPPGSYYIEAEATDNSERYAYDFRYVVVHPSNDDYLHRETIPGRNALVFGSLRNGTVEPDEPAHDGFESYHSIWWTWTAPVSGPVTFLAEGAAETVAVYRGASLTSLIFVTNNWADEFSFDRPRVTFFAAAGTQYQIAMDGYSGGNVALELISAVPPTVRVTSPVNDAATGPTVPVSITATDSDGAVLLVELFLDGKWFASRTNAPWNLTLTNVAPGYHDIYARAVDSQGIPSQSEDIFFRTGPPNDNFAARVVLTGASVSVTGNCSAATSEPGEPDHAGLAADNSVWWRWTAPFSGASRIYTVSEFDTALAVYSGASLAVLTEITSMDGSGGNGVNEVVFIAEAGIDYAIAVQSASFEQDPFLLGVELRLAPLITAPPLDQTAGTGTTVTLTVEAIGLGALNYQWLFNGILVPGAAGASFVLSNVTLAHAGRYQAVVSNAGGSVTSAPAMLQIEALVTLADALDTPSRTWATGGSAGWAGQTLVSSDGIDAGRSGSIGDGQESWLQTTINGPGRLTFWWKVSSEGEFDFLEVYLDGVLQTGRISGEVDWQQRAINIPSGSHIVRWRYSKDDIVSEGADRGWLDQVTVLPP